MRCNSMAISLLWGAILRDKVWRPFALFGKHRPEGKGVWNFCNIFINLYNSQSKNSQI